MKTTRNWKGVCILAWAFCLAFAANAAESAWTFALDGGQSLVNNATGTIVDGEWTLNVWVQDAATRTLGLGQKGKQNYGNAFTGMNPRADGQPGPLDLDKPVFHSSGVAWAIVTTSVHALALDSASKSDDDNKVEWLTSLTFPRSVTTLGNEVAKSNNGKGTRLGSVTMVLPNLTGALPPYAFFGHGQITNFVLKAPLATEVGGVFLYDAQGNASKLSATDATDWELPNVQKLGNRAFAGLSGVRGRLSLPRCRKTEYVQAQDKGTFEGSAFEEIRLGEAATETVRIDKATFRNCKQLTNLVVGGGAASVSLNPSNVFTGCAARNVRLTNLADFNEITNLFLQCVELESVVATGAGALEFRADAFAKCKKLASIDLSGGTSIVFSGTGAFKGSASLTNAVLRASDLVDSGTNTFTGAGKLVRVQLGDADTARVVMRKDAFGTNLKLESIVLGGVSSLYFEMRPLFMEQPGTTTGVPPKLNRLRFLGVPPTLSPEIVNVSCYWGNYGSGTHVPARQLGIEIPSTQAWKDFYAATPLTTLTEEEKTAWRALHPDRAIPLGVLPAMFAPPPGNAQGSPFGCSEAQYVLIGDRIALPQTRLPADGRYGDSIAVAYAGTDFVADADGTVPASATGGMVTFTASSTGENCSFARWIHGGPITEASNTRNPITLSFADAARVVGAAFRHNWVYDAEESTISDGVWTLHAYVVDAAAHTLGVGLHQKRGTYDGVAWNPDDTSKRGHAFTGVGDGRLDLTGVVRDPDGTEWTVSEFGEFAMAAKDCATEFIAPECVTTLGRQLFNNAKLKTAVVESKTLANFGGWAFAFNRIRTAVLRAPNVAELPEMLFAGNSSATTAGAAWGENPLDLTDANEWDLGGVVRASGMRTFPRWCKLNGTLSLTNCSAVTAQGNFPYAFLEGAQNLTNVVLGTGCETLSVASNAFRNARIEAVELGGRTGLAVGADAFVGCTELASARFFGAAPAAETVDRVLAGVSVPSDGTKDCTIWAPRSLGWERLALPPADGETPDATVGLMGVYATAAGERKAWIFHASSPWEPKGTLLLFR